MALSDLDCSICLQRYVHPVELPCGHIFCFLCIKGCALHRRRCPMCRGRFSMRLLDDPKLVLLLESNTSPEPSSSSVTSSASVPGGPVSPQTSTAQVTVPPTTDYRWFYEGYAGWWQYDDRTSDELESAFERQLPSCEVQVAGYIYTIDFVHMTQKRKDNSGRKRRIKRDLRDCEKKGIAGIKLSSIEPKPLHASAEPSNSTSQSPSVRSDPNTSSGNQSLVESVVHATSSLSLTSDPARSTRTQSSVCAASSDRNDAFVQPLRCSQLTLRASQSPSHSQSPSPIPESSSDRPMDNSRDNGRACSSRLSRSVPRD